MFFVSKESPSTISKINKWQQIPEFQCFFGAALRTFPSGFIQYVGMSSSAAQARRPRLPLQETMQGLDRIVGGFHHDVNILRNKQTSQSRLEAKLGWKPPGLDLLNF